MKLSKIIINKYKSIDNVELDFSGYSSKIIPILGKNNVGKSNVLEGINLLNYVKHQISDLKYINTIYESEISHTNLFDCYKFISNNFVATYIIDTTYKFKIHNFDKDSEKIVIKQFILKVTDQNINYYYQFNEDFCVNLIIKNLVLNLNKSILNEFNISIKTSTIMEIIDSFYASISQQESFSNINNELSRMNNNVIIFSKILNSFDILITTNPNWKKFSKSKFLFIIKKNWVDSFNKIIEFYKFLIYELIMIKKMKIFYLNDNLVDLTNLLILTPEHYDQQPYFEIIMELLKEDGNEFIGNLQEMISDNNLNVDELNTYLKNNYKLDFLKNIFNSEDDNDNDDQFFLVASWDLSKQNRCLKIDLGFLNSDIKNNFLLTRDLGFIKQVFISLLINWISYNNDDSDIIILIDDPDTGLHIDSQNWLLKRFNNLMTFKNNLSIMYTTHSPFMFDYRGLTHAVGVYKENKVTQARNILSILNGNKQNNLENYWMGSNLSLLNLIGAKTFWFSMSPDEYDVLLVEGAYDYLYLKYFSEILKLSNQKINIMWAGGAPKIQILANFLEGLNIPFQVLCDNDYGGNLGIQDLSNLLHNHNVTDIYKLMNKTDVESLFENEYFGDPSSKKEHLKLIVKNDIYLMSYNWNYKTLENFRIILKLIEDRMKEYRVKLNNVKLMNGDK